MSDPFRHHPGLKNLITEPETSSFRDLDPSSVIAMLDERGFRTDWINTEDQIESIRRSDLNDH